MHEHNWIVDMFSDDYETVCETCQIVKREKNKYTASIWITYDFENPYFRNEYDEWRDDHPDTDAMRREFVWDRFVPENIMSIVDPNAQKFMEVN